MTPIIETKCESFVFKSFQMDPSISRCTLHVGTHTYIKSRVCMQGGCMYQGTSVLWTFRNIYTLILRIQNIKLSESAWSVIYYVILVISKAKVQETLTKY